MKSLGTALSNRRIALLEAAWGSASLGTWAFSIVLALYAYDVGGATAVGLAVLIRMLPSAIVAPYVGLLADRESRRAVLVHASFSRAVLVLAMGLAVVAGAPFAVVLLVAAAFTVAGTAHKPAQAALLPQYADTPAQLAAANGTWSTVDSAAFLSGSLVAGVLVGATSVETAFAACAIPFLVAALVTLRLPADAPPARLETEEPATGRQEIGEGLAAITADPQMRVLLGIFALDMWVQAMVDVLLVVAALELLDTGSGGVGALSAAWGLGGLAGGVAAVGVLGRGRLAAGIVIGCVLAGLPLAVVGAFPDPATALALLVMLGAGYALVEVGLLTLTQRLAADDVLARVFAVQETVYVLATAGGSLAAVALVAALAPEAALIATGLLLPVVALFLRGRLRSFEATAQVPEAPFRLLRELPIFAPLPLATVETLALRARPVEVGEGATIIETGAHGDEFFVIERGTVEVFIDGVMKRVQRDGEFFGEIALLRDCARTATVVATAPVRLLVIHRDDFLASVGSHARSGQAASSVADERLAVTTTSF